MKYTKKICGSLLICALLIGLSVKTAYAQYMPTVYDRTYGEGVQYQHTCPTSAGEAAIVGTTGEKTTVSWLNREGEVTSSNNLPSGFKSINNVSYVGDNKILILGQSTYWILKKRSSKICGRATVVDKSGNILSDVYLGETGSELFCGQVLRDGSFILGGYEPKTGGMRRGMLGKVNAGGKTIYKYVSNESGTCVGFDVLGSNTEYINAAFTAEDGAVASVARLDHNGKTYFVTNIPDKGFQVNKMISGADDHIILIGNSTATGGRVLKIRPEGNIVFNKEIVPASQYATLDHLYLSNNGNILVGGNGGNRCYYSLLRNDGTDLQKYVLKGNVSAMGMNSKTGESVVVGFDADRKRGAIIGLSSEGRQIYQKATDGNFDKAEMTPSGVYLASTATGRVCMMSETGDLLFDRYAIEDSKKAFNDIHFTSNGDVLLRGENRLIKLGHGIYVSDVKINKPVNGYTTAIFTVTLTGYSTTEQGAPMPVTVGYTTIAGTATETNNYIPVRGNLSFVPSNDGAVRYMVTQEVEVPIKSNNLVEGRKIFEMHLGDIRQSYLVKPVGVGTIEDQEVFVKLVNTEDGMEDQKDVVYELGIFKTNGEELVNATGSDIVIDGIYGKGTADALDYDMGVAPRVIIGKGANTGRFNVHTLSDTRYELPKTVVVDFKKIYTIKDANVAFEGTMLSCAGNIIDQQATIAIKSLGNHGRMNNVVSGLFTVSLTRASDGALLTNATGGDIVVSCSVAPESTAVNGKDYVLTNLHDLRIWGDGNRSAVNLSGIVLYDKDTAGSKNLVVEIGNVSTPDNAPDILVSSDGKSASLVINE